jgi:hypothetical protein
MATVRDLAVKFGLDVDGKSFENGAKQVEKAKESLMGVVKAALKMSAVVAGALTGAIKLTASYGAHLDDTAQAMGVATDELQELQHAALLGGLESEELSQGLTILTRTMRAAGAGSEEAGKAFAKVGVKVSGADGKLRSAADVVGDVAERLSQLPDGAEKTALALQLFGRGGARMVPFLNLGSDGIARMRQEARELGLVMDKEAIRASAELDDNMDRLWATLKGFVRGIVGDVIPYLADVAKAVVAWVKANRVLIGQLVKGLAHAVKGLAEGFVQLIKIGYGVVKTVGQIIGALTDLGGVAKVAAAAIGLALLAVAAPAVALAGLFAGILLLLEDYAVYKRGGKSLIGEFKQAFDEWLKPNQDDPWWLAAIKLFVGYIKEAIALIGKLKAELGITEQKRGVSNKVVVREAEARVRAGVPLGPEHVQALRDSGIDPQTIRYTGPLAGVEAIRAAADPRTAGPLSSTVINRTDVRPTINITMPPGSDAQSVADAVEEKFQTLWNDNMQAADAGVSQ